MTISRIIRLIDQPSSTNRAARSVEQFGVGRRVAQPAEVVCRGDEPRPNRWCQRRLTITRAVKRVARADDILGQFPTAALTRRIRLGVEDFEEPSRRRARPACLVIASDKERLIDDGPFENARRTGRHGNVRFRLRNSATNGASFRQASQCVGQQTGSAGKPPRNSGLVVGHRARGPGAQGIAEGAPIERPASASAEHPVGPGANVGGGARAWTGAASRSRWPTTSAIPNQDRPSFGLRPSTGKSSAVAISM